MTPRSLHRIAQMPIMQRARFLGACGVAVFLLATPLVRGATPTRLIVIVAPELSYTETGFSTTPQSTSTSPTGKPSPTPYLDGLAAKSVSLAAHHGSSLLSPARAMLLTGSHPWHAGVWGTHSGRDRLASGKTTLAHTLKKAGLKTSHFGTWGLGDSAPCRPQDHGYEHVFGHLGPTPGSIADVWGNDGTDDKWMQNNTPRPTLGHGSEAAFAGAAELLSIQKTDSFYIHISPPAALGTRAEAIRHFDNMVSRFCARLQQLKLEKDTLLIITAATGSPEPGTLMRGRSGQPYEHGHHVPCLIHWPSGGLQPRTIRDTTSHSDLLPTITGLLSLPAPALSGDHGLDITPAIKGKTSVPERTLMVEAQDTPSPIPHRLTAVISGDWRLVNGRELYNLRTDPTQRKDISATHSSQAAALRKTSETWWAQKPKLEPVPVIATQGETLLLTARDRSSIGQPLLTQADVSKGKTAPGPWPIVIPQEAPLEVHVHLWPPGETPPTQLLAKKALIKIGSTEHWVSPAPDNASGVWKATLPAGRTSIEGAFLLPDGSIAPALYAVVKPQEEIRPAEVVPPPATPTTTATDSATPTPSPSPTTID